MVCHVCYDASRKQVLERRKIFFGPKSSRTSSPVFSTSSRSFSQKFFFFSNFRIFCLVFGRFLAIFSNAHNFWTDWRTESSFFLKRPARPGLPDGIGKNRKKTRENRKKPEKPGKTRTDRRTESSFFLKRPARPGLPDENGKSPKNPFEKRQKVEKLLFFCFFSLFLAFFGFLWLFFPNINR